MYSRESDAGVRRFGVSGKLWHGVLVMIDRETESLWTQLDGRAIAGELKSQRLEHVPSVYTTFGAWADAHPDTLVLEKPRGARERRESHYADYLADPDRLYMDHLAEGLGEVGGKTVVFGARIGDEALAVTEDHIRSEGTVEAELAGVPIRFVRNEETGAVRAVDRRDGSRVRCDRAFWYAWKRTQPHSRILTG